MLNRQESHIEELPTLKQELQRKAFDQLERLVMQLDRGEINMAQFDTGVKSVWHCVSGLVDQNLIETIEEVKRHAKIDTSFIDSRILMKENRIAFLLRKIGGNAVSLKIEGAENPYDPYTASFNFGDELIPAKSAKEQQEQLTKKFLDNGWKRRI